jgi:hypothetical protein
MRGSRLVLFVLWAWLVVAAAAPAQESWRFAVMGDSRGISTTGVNEKVLSDLVRELLHRDIDLVVFPGDLVHGAGIGPGLFGEQLWNWVRVMQPLYDAGIRVYVCRGNHEIGDMWYALPGELPDPNDNYGLRWLDVFGNDDHPQYRLPDNGPDGEKYMSYSVAHKNALIVGLDQYGGVAYRPIHYINQGWLDSQLESNVKPHVFAFGHEPAFRTLHYDCLDAYPDRRDRLWRSLKAAGSRAYFCCHDHYYDHARVDDGDGDPRNDVYQFIVATAGAPSYTWAPPYNGRNSGFIVTQVYHAARYGYLLVNVDDLEVTMSWMERQGDDPDTQGIYKARDIWTYRVSPNLVMLHPAAGEWVPAGRPYVVRWKTMDGVHTARVFIEYSLDAGGHWALVGEVDNTGSLTWLAPSVDSDRCLVRVSSVRNPELKATTDGTFTIAPCEVMLPADLNGDCRVDFADLAILANQWLAPRSQQ